MKNCDRRLGNAGQGRRPRAAFSCPKSLFFTIQTDPKPVNNIFFFLFLQYIGSLVGIYLLNFFMEVALVECGCANCLINYKAEYFF